MIRSLLHAFVVLMLGLTALIGEDHHAATPAAPAPTVAVPGPGEADALVARFNPNLYEMKDRKPVHHITSTYNHPASDIALAAEKATWFTSLVFLPFLVLPLALLLYVIFKFKDRGDGRKPATFQDHHTLEIVWTAIPCVALVIAGYPMWDLTWKMELPPGQQQGDLVLEVRGKSFAWDYAYQQIGPAEDYRHVPRIEVGQDLVGQQEPVVLCKDRRTILNMTSNDVNHAWWIPAFGVKKDCFQGRYTNVWFTPTIAGFYKGSCTELCGQGHGIMVISAVVLERQDFDLWVALQGERAKLSKVWNTVDAATTDIAAIDAAVAAYLGPKPDAFSRFALSYWVANHAANLSRRPPHGYDAKRIAAGRQAVEAAGDRLANRTVTLN